MKRFGALALSLAFAACSGSVTTVPKTQPAAARGAVLSLARAATITKQQMLHGLPGKVIEALGGVPQCDVALYTIRYATIGVSGEPADASAGFFVPLAGCKKPYVLVGYAQGTNVVKAQMITHPTARNIEPVVIAAIYASHGYAVAATEYLGLGLSHYPYQPYLVTRAEASAVIDSLRAVRNAATTLGVPLTRKVLLTGHSQGGQASVATQRTIEAENAREFPLIADAPSSGPYDLTQTTIDGVTNPGQHAPILASYVLTAYQKAYGNVYSQASEAFQQPYSQWIDNLLPVDTYAEAAKLQGQTIPLAMARLLQPAFAHDFVTNPKNPARVDVAENDLLKGWTPAAPVYLCGGSRDPQVEYKNSQLAYKYFKSRGARVTLTDVNPFMPKQVPRSLYHDAVLVLCLTITRVEILDH